MGKNTFFSVGQGTTVGVDGGGDGGGTPVSVTKKTYKTVKVGALAEIAAADFDHGVSVSIEHGLGETPAGIFSYLEAITADLGYAVGTKIPIQVPWSIVSSNDATHTYITCRSGDARFDIVNRNTNVKAKFIFARWKVVAVPYIFVDTELVTDVTGGDGGDGGSGNALVAVEPGHIYEASDYEKVINIKGVGLVRIDSVPHAGHGKIATPRNLTDDDFDGFATNVYGLAAAEHGKFYFNDQSGFFAIRLANGQDGFTGPTAFYTFDPMGANTYLTTSYGLTAARAAGPWQVAPAGGTYVGALTWRGAVNRSSEIVAAATAVGEVIVVPTEHRALYVDVFAAATEGYQTWTPRVIIPRYYANPVAYFWGREQTERNPATYPNTNTLSGVLRRIRFVVDGPHEEYNGGGAVFDDIFIDSGDVSSDIDTGANLGDEAVFSLRAGRYNIKIFGAFYQGFTDTDVNLSIRKITVGDDDIKVVDTAGDSARQEAGEAVHYVAQAEEKDIVVIGTEQFYVVWAGISTTIATRNYMRIERIG